MDDLKVIGDDIYFGPFKLGSKPPGMPPTQWDDVVAFIREMQETPLEGLLWNAKADAYAEGKRDGYNEARRE